VYVVLKMSLTDAVGGASSSDVWRCLGEGDWRHYKERWKAYLELSNIGSFPNSLVDARDNVEFSLALVGTIGMSSNRWWVGGETCADRYPSSQPEVEKENLSVRYSGTLTGMEMDTK
jgi:hypothetical protein